MAWMKEKRTQSYTVPHIALSVGEVRNGAQDMKHGKDGKTAHANEVVYTPRCRSQQEAWNGRNKKAHAKKNVPHTALSAGNSGAIGTWPCGVAGVASSSSSRIFFAMGGQYDSLNLSQDLFFSRSSAFTSFLLGRLQLCVQWVRAHL